MSFDDITCKDFYHLNDYLHFVLRKPIYQVCDLGKKIKSYGREKLTSYVNINMRVYFTIYIGFIFLHGWFNIFKSHGGTYYDWVQRIGRMHQISSVGKVTYLSIISTLLNSTSKAHRIHVKAFASATQSLMIFFLSHLLGFQFLLFCLNCIGERGNYHKRTCLSFYQHKSLEIVCKPGVNIFS